MEHKNYGNKPNIVYILIDDESIAPLKLELRIRLSCDETHGS